MAYPYNRQEFDLPTPQQPNKWGQIQGWMRAGIMFLLALYLIDLSLPGGKLTYYINVDDFGWLTWIGAFILLAMTAVQVTRLLKGNTNSELDDPEHARAKDGGWTSWLFLAVAATPLILGLGIAARPLGARAANAEDLPTDFRSIGVGAEATSLEIPAEDRNILDWVRAFTTSPDITEFEGQPINVIGFVYRDSRFEGTDNFMVVRFSLSCCVADARPLGLVVEAPQDSQELAQDTWIEVAGKITIREIDGVETPVIIINSITETEQPEQPYLYF